MAIKLKCVCVCLCDCAYESQNSKCYQCGLALMRDIGTHIQLWRQFFETRARTRTHMTLHLIEINVK